MRASISEPTNFILASFERPSAHHKFQAEAFVFEFIRFFNNDPFLVPLGRGLASKWDLRMV